MSDDTRGEVPQLPEPADDNVPAETLPGTGDGGSGGGDEQGNGRKFFEDLTGVNVDWRNALLVPILAIITALVASAFVILISDLDVWSNFGTESLSDAFSEIRRAFIALFEGSLGSGRALSETLTNSSTLILAGLSVAVGFRAGLFNIGTEGQILAGGMAAVWAGFAFDFPVFIHLPLVIIAGAIGGAVWGGIPGLLRAKTGAHEVITTIMMNQIAILLVLYLLDTQLFQLAGRDDPVSKTIKESGRLPRLVGFLDNSDYRVHAGLILALLAAAAVYWLLFRSTIGYEYRAVGANPDAARYGGMSVTRIYISVMSVAGALGGLAAVDLMSGVLHRASPGFSGGLGFEAIALALLGRSHPGGVVVAGLLFGALRTGGQEMQVATDVPIDLILVVQALVVGFIAAPALIRAIYRVRTGEGTGQVTRGWAT